MFKVFLILFLLFSSLVCFGQGEKIGEFPYKLSFLSKLKHTHLIKDEFTDRICVFLEEDGGTNIFVLDSNMQIENEFFLNKQKLESVNLTNAVFKSDDLYFISKSNFGFSRYRIDLIKGKVKRKYIDFDKFERPIFVDNGEDKIFIFNAVKNKSVIRVYSWDLTNDLTQKEYAFNTSNFVQSSVLFKNAKSNKSIIEKDLPIDISSTRFPLKIYYGDENLKISIDDRRRTYTFQMNLNTEEVNFYKNTSFIFKENGVPGLAKYNSFLLDDVVLMVVNRLENMDIYIKNLKSDSLKTWFEIKNDEDIVFRNSNMIIESDGYYYRTLNSTKQFLRRTRARNSILSICAFELNNKIQLEFGGIVEEVVQELVNFDTKFYIELEEKVTKVKCLFDEDYKSVTGNIQLNVLDKIKKEHDSVRDLKEQAMYRLDNKVYFGRYDRPNKKYLIYTYDH